MDWADVVVRLRDMTDTARKDRTELLAGGAVADFDRLLAALSAAVSKATVGEIEALIERPPREGLVQDVEEAVIDFWGMDASGRRIYGVTAGIRTPITAVISVAPDCSCINRFCLSTYATGVRQSLGLI